MEQARSFCDRRHLLHVDSAAAERRTRWVIGLTAAMMVAEIVAGQVFGSMALLADGWHMSTHVAAFLIAAFAYAFSRRQASNAVFSFGTGKVGALGGFASAVVLAVVAALMAAESLERLLAPVAIRFDQSIGVAAVGLGVNVLCALVLGGAKAHGAGHGLSHGHGGDLNLRAAYVHVLADALTSVAAVVALLLGRFWGWAWLDPVMGVAGSAVICIWAYGLVRETGGILLDHTPASSDLPALIRQAVERDDGTRVVDLHVWRVSEGLYAAIVTVESPEPREAAVYHERLREHEELVHLSVEVRHAPGGER